MFDPHDSDRKIEKAFHETGFTSLKDPHEDSFQFEVEAEREYVERLKNQRQKIQSLYSKYDVLLKDLKNKQGQIKEKDRTINNLETKCKNLTLISQETNLFKQQNLDFRSENSNLQKAYSDLEENYLILQGQYKSKENVNGQKFEEIQNLNSQLMLKLKSISKKFQQKQEEFSSKTKQITTKYEEFKLQTKKQKERFLEELQIVKTGLLQKEEQVRLLRIQNDCLRDRAFELQNNIHQILVETDEKMIHAEKERKIQIRVLKNELQNLKQINSSLQKKWNKAKQQNQLKQLSLNQMNFLVDEHDKQNNQAIFLLKQQFNQQKSHLKQQLIQYQNHIAKLERKISDLVRKEQSLFGKIKKYEVCLDAKRNFRQIEKQELEKINHILNTS